MGDRALSPVLGLVLLIGITAIASVSIFVAGATLTDSLQAASEDQQVERSVTEFAATAEAIANGEAIQGSYSINGANENDEVVDPDAGHIELWIENGTSRQDLLDDSLGEVRYEMQNGNRIAYQGGGVWRSDGDGNARIVRSPSFHYRNDNDPTVTFEHITVEEVTGSSIASEGTMTARTTIDHYPKPGDPNPIDNGALYAEIESDYCDGWEQFFRRNTDSAVEEGCSGTSQTTDGEVRIEFVVPFDFPGLKDEQVVTRQHNPHKGSKRFQSHEYRVEDHSFPSTDTIIQSKLDDCADGEGKPLSGYVNQGGLYCGSSMSGDYEFDTRNGDIEVAVTGDVNPDDVKIDGNGNVTFFAGGDYAMSQKGGSEWGLGHNRASQLRYFVESGQQFGGKGSTRGGLTVNGLVYAPDSEVHLPNNLNIHGGIVADKTKVHASAGSYNPRPSIKDMSMYFEAGGEPFYYLHVSETDLLVEKS